MTAVCRVLDRGRVRRALGDELGQDRDGHLDRRPGADVEPGGDTDALAQVVGHVQEARTDSPRVRLATSAT